MASLREIKKRMHSVKSTRQITRTMEMVSTAKIRRALDLAKQAGPYKDTMTAMLAAVCTCSRDVEDPLLQRHDNVRCVLFVVIASDGGLAGGFNIAIQRDVEHEIEQLKKQGIQAMVITCGRKPTDYFKYRDLDPVLAFTGMSSEPTQDEAERVASFIIDGYVKGTFDRVMLYYNHAKNRVEQVRVVDQILPIVPEQLSVPAGPRTKVAEQSITHSTSSFEFDPSPGQVLGYLMPSYIKTIIFHALLDSAAAEHGARRRAMQAATDNATEIVNMLERVYNRTRQGSITTELTEIVSGAAALEDF